MTITESKIQFIHTWGILSAQWGINRTMAQIHALLLMEKNHLSTDEIMEKLNISRGNANMNIRDLMIWGLVQKIHISGERMEYYKAEKDIHKVAVCIAKERIKRELEPVIFSLKEIKNITNFAENEENIHFIKLLNDIDEFASMVQRIMTIFVQSDKNWFYKKALNFFK